MGLENVLKGCQSCLRAAAAERGRGDMMAVVVETRESMDVTPGRARITSTGVDCLTHCTLSAVLKIIKIFMKGLLKHRASSKYFEAKELHMAIAGHILFQIYLQSNVLLGVFCI